MDFFSVICFILLVLLLFYLSRSRVKYVYPPGPKGWPFIGSFLDVSSTHLHLSLTEIGKQYGDIFSINLLGTHIIVLNSANAMRDAFAAEDNGVTFAGRPFNFIGKYTDDNCCSLSFMPISTTWQRLRKMALKTLNRHGNGIQDFESDILAELGHVALWLENRVGMNVDLFDVIAPSFSNIMSYLLLGRRFDYNSPEIRSALEMSHGLNEIGNPRIDTVLTKLPILRYLPFGCGTMYRNYMKSIDEFYTYFYHAPKATYHSDVKRGYIDLLLKTQEELSAKGDYSLLTDDHVRSALKDLMLAGTLSMRSIMMTFFLVIAYNPHVARRIQGEIDREIGGDRHPSLKDRPDMPYTDAAIIEIIRFITPGPLALPHTTTAEKRYKEYLLPKETVVVANYWGIHHDPAFWDKPFEFRPERFLDESGKMLPSEHPNRQILLNFGIGKRACPAESFSKSWMFLYITSLLQRFNFRPVDGVELPCCDPREFCQGITQNPQRFKVIVQSRS